MGVSNWCIYIAGWCLVSGRAGKIPKWGRMWHLRSLFACCQLLLLIFRSFSLNTLIIFFVFCFAGRRGFGRQLSRRLCKGRLQCFWLFGKVRLVGTVRRARRFPFRHVIPWLRRISYHLFLSTFLCCQITLISSSAIWCWLYRRQYQCLFWQILNPFTKRFFVIDG